MLCVKFGWNWPSGSGEKDENVKSLQHRGRQWYDNNGPRTNFGLGELKRNQGWKLGTEILDAVLSLHEDSGSCILWMTG